MRNNRNNRKNRKIRKLRELYPDVQIKLLNLKDMEALVLKYREKMPPEANKTENQMREARKKPERRGASR
jgi:hypothetical protein